MSLAAAVQLLPEARHAAAAAAAAGLALGGGLVGFTAARVYLMRRLRAAERWQAH